MNRLKILYQNKIANFLKLRDKKINWINYKEILKFQNYFPLKFNPHQEKNLIVEIIVAKTKNVWEKNSNTREIIIDFVNFE
jgi:hypothetical protein